MAPPLHGSWQRTVLPAPPGPRWTRLHRATAPGVLAAVVAAACGLLGVLNDPHSPRSTGPANVAQIAAMAHLSSRLVDDLPPRTAPRAVPAKKVAAAVPAKAKATSAKRASRSKRVSGGNFTGRYACPVGGRHSFVDSWGDRRGRGRGHQGVDMMARHGTPILAVTSGVVRTAHSRAGGISLYLHGSDGVEYFYAHNSRNAVRSGERVRTGEVIAYVGSSGNASGGSPHLHFERHPGRRAVNPYPFVARLC
ncbi:MAG TPA: M23 family metallopeptidase [Mycobacteriales bacterium]|nr:M23 family metallopeptidase [Mycobacteriales bacterium]